MTDTTIGINGMAHVILTVSQFAAARAFYGRLLPALGMTRGGAGQPSASSQPVRRMTATTSCKAGLACTIYACEPVRAKTWIACMICFDRLGPP